MTTTGAGRRLPLVGFLVIGLAVVGTAGCSSERSASSPSTVSSGVAPPASSPSTTATVATSTSGAMPAPVELAESDGGRTVSIHVGDSVTVELHSTYWALGSPAPPGVLEAQGPPVVTPRLQGCVSGQGCGTVTGRYLATAPGETHLVAHRDTCGEAMPCPADQQGWQVTLTVE